jgi:phosphoribosylformylglycinamidine synthase
MYLARIYIQLKESVLDPQGQAVTGALHHMGNNEVKDVRIGKYIELRLDTASKEEAEKKVQGYCETLLANAVIETFRFDLESVS